METSSTTAPEMTDAQKLAANYRAVADWLDARPDLPVTVTAAVNLWGFRSVIESSSRLSGLDAKPQIAEVAKIVGGKLDKSADETWFMLNAEIETPFGMSASYEFNVDRELVCERRVIGTETVEIPATDAIPARPARTEEREKVEWVCPPSLLGADS